MGITHGESKNTAEDTSPAMEQERRIDAKTKKEYLAGAIYQDGEAGRKVTVSIDKDENQPSPKSNWPY